MRVHLGPGESFAKPSLDAARPLFDDPSVAAVLVPLVPTGDHLLARAARRYLAAWDGRFLHPQTFFAPASRALSRDALPGFRNGDWAGPLADALTKGARVVALREAAVECDIGRDLDAWTAHWRAEGEAWGRAAAKDARLRPFVTTRAHLLRPHRRVVEALQARAGAPGVLLHLAREAAWARGCQTALRP